LVDEPEPVILEADEPPAAGLRAWLELCRLPNVFTAMADVLLGFLLVHESLAPWWTFGLLLAASSLMYTAGMVLNDVFDEAIDREERPARPIPSGRVPLALALQIGGVMLGAGLALGWAATAIEWQLRSGLVATALAVGVLGYDRILKRTPIAPVVMGSCRFLNVLLGASAGSVAWRPLHFAVAAGIGTYIAGVTWFARTEARESRRTQLAAATCVMAAGLALLAWFPKLADRTLDPVSFPNYALDIGMRWYVLWGVLGAMILWRCLAAVASPSPRRVQMAVKESILSLVILDAVACFAARGMEWSIVILLLLIPTMFLGRWIYST
jgi:4-hydroxybenzoate polyprenyltransferase